jgi:type IV secretory pathway VirB10-like protein
MFMQTPVGMLVFVGIPLCGFILYDIIRRRLADQKEKAKETQAQVEIERLRAELEAKAEADKQEAVPVAVLSEPVPSQPVIPSAPPPSASAPSEPVIPSVQPSASGLSDEIEKLLAEFESKLQ